MKKKILLMLTMVAMMVCVLAIGINASTIYRNDDGEELFSYEVDSNNIITSYEGAFPKEDDSGNALTWYVTATTVEGNNTIKKVSSFITTDPNFSAVSNSGVYSYKGIERTTVVSANFPEGITELNLDKDTYGWQAQTRNLLFIYFPSTMSKMESRLCQETPVIACEFHKDSTFDTLGGTVFYNCKNLREIFIPDSVTTIEGSDAYRNQGSAFYNCVSLTKVTFENVEADLKVNEDGTSNALTLTGGTFALCTSLTSITLPNRTISVGPRAFEYANSLVEIRFGSAVERSVYVSIVHCCPSMKYYYIPSTWTSVCNHTFSIDGGYGPNDRVFFYAGTKEQLDVFINAAATSGYNQRLTDIKKENIIMWDSTKSDDYYKELATTNNTGYIVYGYDSCKAFYGNNHTESTVVTYENFSQAGVKVTGCTRSNCNHKEVEELSALFTCLGYSASLTGKNGIVIGFTVNNVAIAEYEEITGKTLKYGVFAVLQSKLGDNDVFSEDGTVAEGVINADLSNQKFDAIQIKVFGFTDTQKDTKLAMGAYVAVTDGETTEYSYMQGGKPNENEKYCFVSYNDIVETENENTLENIKDKIENSDASADDKEAAKDWLEDQNKDINDNILNNDSMNDQEKNDALGDKYQDMKDQINQGMQDDQEQYDKDADSFKDKNENGEEKNDNLQNAGDALKENNKDKLDEATGNIKEDNQNQTDEAWKETVMDLIGDLENIEKNPEVSDEMKDIVSDYKDKLEGALDKVQPEKNPTEGDWEQAKDEVNNATDEFNKELGDFMEDHFGAQEMGKDMVGELDQVQDKPSTNEDTAQ